MVLSASTPADPLAPDGDRWVQRILRHLALTDRGILLLVDNGRPWQLATLLRQLVEDVPEVEVYTDPSDLAHLPIGSTAILVPRAQDAESLNMARALFSRNELRVVLFCEQEISEALRRNAPDFYDWISLVVQCPKSSPPHIVQAIRDAIRIRAPGIAWVAAGDDARIRMQDALQDCTGGDGFYRVKPQFQFDSLVREVRNHQRPWLYAVARDESDVRRFRWGLAATRRKGRTVILVPPRLTRIAHDVGFFLVRGDETTLAAGRNAFVALHARNPGRLSSLTRADPRVFDLAVEFLRHIDDESKLEFILRFDLNPSDTLQRLLFDERYHGRLHSELHLWFDGAGDDTPLIHSGHMALRAFEAGEIDVGNYFAKIYLRRRSTDTQLRRQLLKFVEHQLIVPNNDLPPEVGYEDASRTEARILLHEITRGLDDEEMQIIALLFEDCHDVEIGERLNRSIDWVQQKRKQILAKLRRTVQ